MLQEFYKRRLRRPGAMSLPMWLDIARIDWRRYRNLRLLAKEYAAGKTKLRALPAKLIVEATNVCNLNCPGCFTGLGENGRVRSSVSLETFRRLMDELGPTLIEVEFFNWGEPLLCKSIYAMVEDAHRRGIGTHVTTNFSVPFDEAKAEALVKSGLDNLGVSLDGATQEGYEKYRRGGDIATVIRNARLVAEAKRRLNSSTPRMVWSFHVFEHNQHEMDLARSMAGEIGFDDIAFVKGYTIGDEWETRDIGYIMPEFTPSRCAFLWHYAVVHNDGGVAPCGGTFYREDDIGRISVKDGDGGAESFREVWNSRAFQDARALFADGRKDPPAHPCGTVCASCPSAKVWWNYQAHEEKGGTRADFDAGYTSHDGFNYFLTRRPAGRDTRKVLKPRREKEAERV